MNKKELLLRKQELTLELSDIEEQLRIIELRSKPFEATLYGYSSPGVSNIFYATEEAARNKYEEYCCKRYFRNGLVYGAALWKHNEDGTRTRLDYVEKVHYWKCPND